MPNEETSAAEVEPKPKKRGRPKKKQEPKIPEVIELEVSKPSEPEVKTPEENIAEVVQPAEVLPTTPAIKLADLQWFVKEQVDIYTLVGQFRSFLQELGGKIAGMQGFKRWADEFFQVNNILLLWTYQNNNLFMTLRHLPSSTQITSEVPSNAGKLSVLSQIFEFECIPVCNDEYDRIIEEAYREESLPDEPDSTVEVDSTIDDEPPAVPVVKPINPEVGRGKTLDLQSLGIEALLAMVNVADTTQQIALVVDGAVDGEAWLDLNERSQFIEAVRAKYVTLARISSAGGRIPVFEKAMKEHAAKLEEERHEEEEIKKWNAEIAESEATKSS